MQRICKSDNDRQVRFVDVCECDRLSSHSLFGKPNQTLVCLFLLSTYLSSFGTQIDGAKIPTIKNVVF